MILNNSNNLNNTMLFQKYRLPYLLKLLIIFASFLFVFISCDNNIMEQSPHTLFFRNIFYKGLIHERLFSIYDYTHILLSVLLIRYGGIRFSESNKLLKIIFFATVLNFITLMVNPNNAARYMFFGMPLISYVPVYTELLLMFTLFFLKNRQLLTEVCFMLVKYILFFLIIKISYLFFLWIQGKGNYSLFGLHSILIEEDTLLNIALFQMLIFTLYLIYREKKYLFLWLILFAFLIISFRRSGMFLAFISTFLISFLYVMKESSYMKKYGYIVLFIAIALIVFYSIQFFPYKYGMYIARYIGEYIDIPGVPYHDTFKNMHLEQANWGFLEALGLLPFWGYGYGTGRGDIVPILTFGNTGLHNAYISVWMYYSLYTMIYFVLLAYITLSQMIKHLKKKIINKRVYFIRAVFIIYSFLFFVNGWVLPTGNFTEIKMGITRIFIFVFILVLSDDDLIYIFEKKMT